MKIERKKKHKCYDEEELIKLMRKGGKAASVTPSLLLFA